MLAANELITAQPLLVSLCRNPLIGTLPTTSISKNANYPFSSFTLLAMWAIMQPTRLFQKSECVQNRGCGRLMTRKDQLELSRCLAWSPPFRLLEKASIPDFALILSLLSLRRHCMWIILLLSPALGCGVGSLIEILHLLTRSRSLTGGI